MSIVFISTASVSCMSNRGSRSGYGLLMIMSTLISRGFVSLTALFTYTSLNHIRNTFSEIKLANYLNLFISMYTINI